MARLKQDRENELPFIVPRILSENKSGLEWSELWNQCKKDGMGSTATLGKYLDILQESGWVKKQVDESRTGAPTVYAITDAGLDQLERHKDRPGKRLIQVASNTTQMTTDPAGIRHYLEKLEQKKHRSVARIANRSKFYSIPIKCTSTIFFDKNNSKDDTTVHHSKVKQLPELVANAILQARFDQVSGGKVAKSIREEYEWIRKAFDLEAEIIIDFDGRSSVKRYAEHTLRKEEKVKKKHERNLTLFRTKLLDQRQRTNAMESLVAFCLKEMTDRSVDEGTAEHLVEDVLYYWKECELPDPPESNQILQILKQWEHDGIVETVEGVIEITGDIEQKQPEKAEGAVIAAIAYMKAYPPPRGKAKPEP